MCGQLCQKLIDVLEWVVCLQSVKYSIDLICVVECS